MFSGQKPDFHRPRLIELGGLNWSRDDWLKPPEPLEQATTINRLHNGINQQCEYFTGKNENKTFLAWMKDARAYRSAQKNKPIHCTRVFGLLPSFQKVPHFLSRTSHHVACCPIKFGTISTLVHYLDTSLCAVNTLPRTDVGLFEFYSILLLSRFMQRYGRFENRDSLKSARTKSSQRESPWFVSAIRCPVRLDQTT